MDKTKDSLIIVFTSIIACLSVFGGLAILNTGLLKGQFWENLRLFVGGAEGTYIGSAIFSVIFLTVIGVCSLSFVTYVINSTFNLKMKNK